MTALDPTSIIEELRNQERHFGQFDPVTVRKLIAATERTSQWPLPGYRPQPTPFRRDTAPTDELVPMPRGGRSTSPPAADATVLSFPTKECADRRPGPGWGAGLLCGEAPGHRGPHVAYGLDDRIIGEWPNTADGAEGGA